MTVETRTAAFRRAVLTWQRGPAKAPPPPSLIALAVAAILEQERTVARATATAAARSRAALSALGKGDTAEAIAILKRVIEHAAEKDASDA